MPPHRSCSRKPQQLKRRGAYAARRPGNQSRLSWLHLGNAMDYLPSRNVVQDRRRCLHLGDLIGDGQEVLGLANNQLAVAAVHRECGDSFAEFEAGETGSDDIDDPRDLVAWNEGHFRGVRIVAGKHGQVGWADPEARTRTRNCPCAGS